MNIEGYHSLIAVSVIVFYTAVVLFFIIFALMIRLVPAPIMVPTVHRPRQGTILRPGGRSGRGG
jgi:hypothetical protein